MTIYGFFATIIICATVLGGIWLLAKFPLSIRIKTTKVVEAPKVVIPPAPKTDTKEEEHTVTNKLEDETKVVSMDAVIKAANELMGIQTTEEDK